MMVTLFLLALLSLTHLEVAHGKQGFEFKRESCSLDDETSSSSSTAGSLVSIAQNPETKEFVLITDGDENKGSRRAAQKLDGKFVRGSDSVFNDLEDTIFLDLDEDTFAPAFQLSGQGIRRNQATDVTDDWPRFQARECICSNEPASSWFCLSNYSTCAIRSTWTFVEEGDQPGCFNQKGKEVFVRFSYYFIISSYVMIVTGMACSRMGRSFVGYCLSCCWPKYNRWISRHLLEKRPSEARKMIYDHFEHRRLQLERDYRRALRNRTPEAIARAEAARLEMEGAMNETLVDDQNQHERIAELALRTQKYSDIKKKLPSTKAADLDDEEQQEVICSICFGPFQDDDRIGALPCNHIFHVDPCLKSWLTRRNTCPLCVTDNIATLRYRTVEKKPDVNNEDNPEEEEAISPAISDSTGDPSHDTGEASPPVLPSASREFV